MSAWKHAIPLTLPYGLPGFELPSPWGPPLPQMTIRPRLILEPTKSMDETDPFQQFPDLGPDSMVDQDTAVPVKRTHSGGAVKSPDHHSPDEWLLTHSCYCRSHQVSFKPNGAKHQSIPQLQVTFTATRRRTPQIYWLNNVPPPKRSACNRDSHSCTAVTIPNRQPGLLLCGSNPQMPHAEGTQHSQRGAL